jgi:hypothetical protein
MKKIEGFWDNVPTIKRLSFPQKGKMQVDLSDRRIIIVPVSAFPSIKKLSVAERKHWYLLGNGITFDHSNEVIHIEQILGNYQNYNHG